MESLTAEVLNFLIFRYLQESGFQHSAFIFHHEAGTDKFPIEARLVPGIALIKLVQKGLVFIEMEANSINTDSETDEYFMFKRTMDLVMKDVSELQQLVRDKKKELQEAGGNQKGGPSGGDPIIIDTGEEKARKAEEKEQETEAVDILGETLSRVMRRMRSQRVPRRGRGGNNGTFKVPKNKF